ncbi:hypothetical protein PUP75_11405 [Pseudomonas chlororaphis]|nr:hypothetical protein [Pseudomonas chlororaphis]WDH56183.1 hypothetical protein PUP75_11405 [Pseudomonas chlororaphis]
MAENLQHTAAVKYPTPPENKGRKKIRSTSEKSPSKVGRKSELRSEKYPTNQDTNHQDTNQGTSISSTPQAAAKAATGQVVAFAPQQPRCEIPADMPGPKDQACKTFKAWANYAMAYRKCYNAWPVWNAKVAGQVGQLIDRLGTDVAHHVAAYFLTIDDSRLINGCHGIGDLLAKAEAYHTQWATNRRMNSTTAQQIERKQANLTAGQDAANRIPAPGEGPHTGPERPVVRHVQAHFRDDPDRRCRRRAPVLQAALRRADPAE